MIDNYKNVIFNNYTNFSGRARRSEYWYFALCNVIISSILYVLMIATIVSSGGEGSALPSIISGILFIYSLATFLPSVAVTVRRLHDIGKSGWTYFIALIPFGAFVVLYWLTLEGETHDNKWGADPKQSHSDIDEIGK